MLHNEQMKQNEQIRAQNEKRDQRVGFAISGGIHVVLVVLFYLLTAYAISDPPPGDMTVEMAMADYGMTDRASGDTESEVPSENIEEVEEENVSQTNPVTNSNNKPIETQDNSSVSTPSGKDGNKTTEQENKPKLDNALNNILNQINNNKGGGGSDGDDEDGVGNKGNEEGNIDGKGVFGGKDGNGWELSGRGMIGEPKLNEKPTEEGRVVLDIYVDKNGNVISTARNYNASNTSSDYLFKLAEKAAKTAKFTVNANAPSSQKGKMTFNFKLR